jgi:hypothetical protein
MVEDRHEKADAEKEPTTTKEDQPSIEMSHSSISKIL